jgi:hypothetical protein
MAVSGRHVSAGQHHGDDATEAGAVAEPVASRYRTWPYDRLVEELLDKPTIAEVAAG